MTKHETRGPQFVIFFHLQAEGLGDQDSLGGKLSEDKKTTLNNIKETTLIEENGSNVSTSDLEEKFAGTYSV